VLEVEAQLVIQFILGSRAPKQSLQPKK